MRGSRRGRGGALAVAAALLAWVPNAAAQQPPAPGGLGIATIKCFQAGRQILEDRGTLFQPIGPRRDGDATNIIYHRSSGRPGKAGPMATLFFDPRSTTCVILPLMEGDR